MQANPLRRLATLSRRGQMALAVLSGALASLGLAPFHLWPLALVALGFGFALFAAAPSRRAAAWRGWAFGLGYFTVALVWIVEPFLVEPLRHGFMAPFALVGMAGGLALFWALAFALSFGRGPLALALCLTLAEMARSYVLTGFPWALLGYVFTPSPMALYAAWVGPHGLTLLAGLVAAGLSLRASGRALGAYATLFAAGLALLAAPRLLAPLPDAPDDAPLLRLVQPNAAQHEKWQPELIPLFFQRQLDYTAAPRDDGARPDLTIWPETSVPWALEGAGQALEEVAAAAGGAPVVLGVQRLEDGRKIFNSLALLGPSGTPQAVYDKHHLVPFGEYIPMAGLLGRFGLRGLAEQLGGTYTSGTGPKLIELPRIGTALPLICYEAVFPQGLFGTPTRPALLLQITNDAWFGAFSGPFQHLDQARMRAIEQGLPLVRAANTGVSALIDPRGALKAALPLGQAGYLDVRLPAPLPPTLYARTGDWPVLLLCLLGLAAIVAFGTRRNSA